MPLYKGPGSAVVSGKVIDFAVVNDAGATVRCLVTHGAIADLARVSSPSDIDPASVNPLSVYLDWQLAIERVANKKYDAGDHIGGGLVVVAARDLIRAGLIL